MDINIADSASVIELVAYDINTRFVVLLGMFKIIKNFELDLYDLVSLCKFARFSFQCFLLVI